MTDPSRTNQELIEEISSLKQRIQELEASEAERKRAEQEVTILAEIGRVIGSTLEIDEVYERMATEIRKLISFDSLMVNLRNAQQETLVVTYISGLDIPSRKAGDSFPLLGTIGEEAMRTKRGVVLQSENPEDLVAKFPGLIVSVRAGMRSVMTVPLIFQDEAIGNLIMRSKKPDAYSEDNLRLAEKIGIQIAGAIANAHLFNDLSKTEQSLRESEEKNRALFEDGPIESLVVDREGRIIQYNKAIEHAAEKGSRRLPEIGSRMYVDYASSHSIDMRAELMNGIHSKTAKTFNEMPYKGRFLNINIAPTKEGAIISTIDVTERKQAEEEKRRNQETAERLAEEMEVIAEVGRVVSSTLDINRVYELVATETRKLIPYDRLLVNLKKTQDGQFITAYVSGIDNPRRRVGDLYPSQGSATGVVMNTRAGMLIQPTDAEEIKDLYPNLYETFKTGLRSTMSVPLLYMDEVIGSMSLRSEKLKAYTERDLQLAERIGMQVAGAIANAQLYNDLNKTEKSLRESESKFRALVDQAAVGVAEIDMATGRFLTVNRRLCEMVGRTKEEMLADTFQAITHPEDLHRHEDHTALLLAGKIGHYSLEKRYIRKDGAIIWVNLSVSPLWKPGEKPGRNMVVVDDITERKQAAEELAKSHDLLRNLARLVPGVIYQYRLYPDGRSAFPYSSPGMNDIYEATPEEVREDATPVFGRLHPDDYDHVVDAIQKSARTLQTFYCEFRVILPRQGLRWRWSQAHPERLVDGSILWHGIISDITERKQAEEALRESEERYRQLVEYAPAGIYEADLTTGRLLSVNEVLCEYSGYTRDELLALNPLDLMTEESQKLILQRMASYAAGEPVPPTVEYKARSKTGREFWISTNAKYFYRAGLPVRATVVAHDITERKRVEEEKRSLEERLQRSEKMEALGQLAGGVAHDLNNVLGILSGYSELLLEEIPEGHRSRGHAEKILQSTEKGAAIIQDLLTLARRGVTASDVINLNSVVSGFLKTPVFEKMKDYHPRVTFRTECDKNLLNIKGSPVHLEKTVMNLVSNAAESISGKGEVTIRTESRYLDKPVRGYDEVKEGDYAVLTVSDTGMGIPAENIEKIFEPFYTKKTMGRSGTGLGLAIVWGTVKDHNGYIDVQTEVGKGTTFTLYFPVTREELIAPQQKVPIERYMGKGESVLVVDDIAEQRDVASRLLTRLGYEVHVVSSGEEAVEYLKRHKADILVLDMIMTPGIDGLETYQRVLEINPKQKAILVSGFSETERVKEAQRLGAGAYVKKPYMMEKIGVAVRDELDRNVDDGILSHHYKECLLLCMCQKQPYRAWWLSSTVSGG